MRIYCLLLAACCSLYLSCGQVGEPLPPLLNIPARVESVEAQQFEDKALLRWSPVLLTTEGSTLKNLDRIVVYGVEIARDTPPAAPEALAPYFKVVAEAGPDDTEVGIPVSDRFGQRTAFAVQAASSKGKLSPWSALAVLDLVAPPEPPTNLQAEPRENGVALTWSHADRATGYVVERVVDDEDFAAVGEAGEAQWVDESAQFDVSYRYRVRGRADATTGAVPGPPSVAVAITPQDVFPPSPPQGLRVIRTPQSVELSWSASPEGDLAGYRVERGGSALNQELLTAPAFSDREAPAGKLTYQIVAVDREGNSSEPSLVEVE